MKLQELSTFTDKRIIEISALLDKLPKDEIFSTKDTSRILNMSDRTLHTYKNNLNKYTQKILISGTIERFWGNAKTIAVLREQKADICR